MVSDGVYGVELVEQAVDIELVSGDEVSVPSIAIPGPAGSQPELRVVEGVLQWRPVQPEPVAWTDLIDLADHLDAVEAARAAAQAAATLAEGHRIDAAAAAALVAAAVAAALEYRNAASASADAASLSAADALASMNSAQESASAADASAASASGSASDAAQSAADAAAFAASVEPVNTPGTVTTGHLVVWGADNRTLEDGGQRGAYAGVYTGTDAANVDYPIGTIVLCIKSSSDPYPPLNSPRLLGWVTSTVIQIVSGGSPSAEQRFSGAWRYRGRIAEGQHALLMQRVA